MKQTCGFIASWWFTAVVVLVMSGAYFSFSFGKEPYSQWKDFVFRSSAGLAVYFALVLNLLAASVRIIHRRLRPPVPSSEMVRLMDAHAEIPAQRDDAFAPLSSWLEAKGFGVTKTATGIHAVRGKYSFLPGTVFRLGLVLVLVALPVSMHLRKDETGILQAGRTMEFFGRSVTLSSIQPDLPEDFLQVGEDNMLRIENASAAINAGNRSYMITSRSPEKIGDVYYRITNLGYAQSLSIKGAGKLFETALDLDVLPPGKAQIVSLPGGDAFLTLTLEPDRTITKGIFKGRQYNLLHPFYRIVVQKGNKQGKTQGIALRPEGRGASGGLSLALGESGYFVTVQAVYDPALFWIHLGLILILSGTAFMLSRFFWFEKRFSAVIEGKKLVAGYSEEYFKKWGVAAFQAWKEELAALNRP